MNGWGFIFWLASVGAVFSLLLVVVVGLSWHVGWVGTRGLAPFLAIDPILWVMA